MNAKHGKDLKLRAREIRNEYMRQYRKKNPDKVREINKRYWERKAEREQEEQEDEHQNDQVQN